MKSKGFTLIEVLIVVAIIGILTAIAAPDYKAYMARNRLKGAANQLFTDCMNARMQAISENRNVVVHLTSSTGYTIVRDLNGNGVFDTGETGPAKSLFPDYYDITFTSSADPVFYPNGTGLTRTITVTSSTGATKTITISTAGRIKIS